MRNFQFGTELKVCFGGIFFFVFKSKQITWVKDRFVNRIESIMKIRGCLGSAREAVTAQRNENL